MTPGNVTAHHKHRALAGLGMIIGLPFILFGVMGAIANGLQGLTDWISTPVWAVGLIAFLTVTFWYCKLEFDEVVVDYFDGRVRKFGLTANLVVAVLAWGLFVYAILKLTFSG